MDNPTAHLAPLPERMAAGFGPRPATGSRAHEAPGRAAAAVAAPPVAIAAPSAWKRATRSGGLAIGLVLVVAILLGTVEAA